MHTFAQQWLISQCEVNPDTCSAVVLLLGENGPSQFYTTAHWPDDLDGLVEFSAIAQLVLSQNCKIINREVRGSGNKDQLFDYVALPFYWQDVLLGVVALKFQYNSNQDQQKRWAALEHNTNWLALACRCSLGSDEFYSRVIKLVVTALDQDTLNTAANALVTELSTELGCERVTLGIVKQNCAQILALSNSTQFKPKANLVRSIAKAMDEAVDQEAIINYSSNDESEWLVQRAHKELAKKFQSESICTYPLVSKGTIIGALTLEGDYQQGFDAETIRLCGQTLAVLAPYLELKLLAERGSLQKCKDMLKQALGGFLGLEHLRLKLVASSVFIFLTFAGLSQGIFRLTADAILEGRVQRAITAPMDGYIYSAPFRAGDRVNQGDVLATLDDTELKLEHLKLSSQKQQIVREYRQAMAQNDRVKVRVLSAQVEQTKAEIELIQQQLDRIQIIAPFGGLVIDGDLSQSLGSPIEKGKSLFKIAPLDGYRIVLKVEERSIAHVAIGQTGSLALASLPSNPLPLVVEKITRVATIEDQSNVFRVEASLQEMPDILRPGMKGVGKIEVGTASLLWIWTHDLIDWLRFRIWAWWP